MSKKKSIEEFVKESNTMHNGKYTYTNAEYVNNNTKLCITCPVHGDFWQTPENHLKNHGCPQCASDKRKLTSKSFINKAKEIYGEKYDYSQVVYKSIKDNVSIICPEHGLFWMTPQHHLAGHKCSQCTAKIKEDRKRLNKKAQERDANPKHTVQKCPTYTLLYSNKKEMLFDFIKSIYSKEIVRNCNDLISPYNLDIYLPEDKIAFEINGLMVNSEIYKEKKISLK